jgi:bacteriocin-like protein
MMSTSKENQNRPESKPEITIAPPPPGMGETLSDEDLDHVSGGINPQPLPPRHD